MTDRFQLGVEAARRETVFPRWDPAARYERRRLRESGTLSESPISRARRAFWTNVIVDPTTKCWIWVGKRHKGYGNVDLNGTRRAHNIAYEMCVGVIPVGLMLDHLCRNPACVNPGHLEPVTGAVNTQRGDGPIARNWRATHCLRGHLFSGDNVHYLPNGRWRVCVTCRRARSAAIRQRAKLAALLPVSPPAEQERT